MESEFHRHGRTRPATDQGPRLGARRTTWPTVPWLEARFAMGSVAAEVDLVGRPPGEGGVRPVLVVPIAHECQFTAHRSVSNRDEGEAGQEPLDREDQSFDDGDTAMLTDRSEPWPDSAASTPAAKAVAPELGALVADEMLGRDCGGAYGLSEKRPNLLRSRLLAVDGKAHEAARVMIDDQRVANGRPMEGPMEERAHGRHPDIARFPRERDGDSCGEPPGTWGVASASGRGDTTVMDAFDGCFFQADRRPPQEEDGRRKIPFPSLFSAFPNS